MSRRLLSVRNLKTSFFTHVGEVKAVRGISFDVNQGEVLGIVGESGSGKSVTSLSIMGLLQHPGRVVDGEIFFQDQDILSYGKRRMRRVRGKEIAMIFQDPMTSLNPVYTVGNQIMEMLQEHEDIGKGEAKRRAIEMLRMVGIPSPEKRIHNYPHEFSGGQRQRIGIARALAVNPEFIVCDEPISALDVSIQAQVVNMLEDLQREFGLTYLFIAHDLSMVRHISNRIGVMYLGKLVEVGDSEEIYQNHLHPYTEALLSSVPLPDPELAHRSEPIMLQGDIPSPIDPPSGCRFRTRCPYATQLCAEQEPPLTEVGSNHAVACHRVTPARGNEEKGGIL